jgi:transposase
VGRLVEQLELQIEDLTLARSSPLHTIQLQQTVVAQQSEIKRLSRTIENKSKQLLEAQRFNHQLQHKLQLRVLEAQQHDHQLQTRIRELEKCLESDDFLTTKSATKSDSHNSNLPPSLDPPWNKPQRTRSLRKKSGLRAGGQPGHKGFTLRQVSNPDSVIVHQVQICEYCRQSLISVESKRIHKRQVFEIENGSLRVIEHQVEVKCCPACQKVSKADFPANVKAPVQYGVSVISRLVYLNLYQLLPVARTAETMRDLFSCPVSLATVQRAAHFCSSKLLRCEQRIKAAIRDSAVIGADETGIRINGKLSWVHVARNENLTHLAPHSKRGKEAIETIGIINRFQGVLVRDGFTSYQQYEQCRHSLCNAHLLRDLTFVGENEPVHQAWTTELAKLLLKIKETVKAAQLKGKTALTYLQQRRFFNRYDRILAEAEQVIRGSPAKKAIHLSARTLCRRFFKNKTEVLRFMTDFAVPFDNNGSERDLRMLKLQQKISGCFRTTEGVKVFCRVRSYLSSVRKQGRSLLLTVELALKGKPIALTN